MDICLVIMPGICMGLVNDSLSEASFDGTSRRSRSSVQKQLFMRSAVPRQHFLAVG